MMLWLKKRPLPHNLHKWSLIATHWITRRCISHITGKPATTREFTSRDSFFFSKCPMQLLPKIWYQIYRWQTIFAFASLKKGRSRVKIIINEYSPLLLLRLASLHRFQHFVLETLRRGGRFRILPRFAWALRLLGLLIQGRRRWGWRFVLTNDSVQHVDHILDRVDFALNLGLQVFLAMSRQGIRVSGGEREKK